MSEKEKLYKYKRQHVADHQALRMLGGKRDKFPFCPACIKIIKAMKEE